jgi:hypothetical protein
MNNIISNKIVFRDLIEKIVKKCLPHGSGFNYDWNFNWLSNGKLELRSSYQCMNEYGFYDGHAEFKVIFPITEENYSDFKLSFIGNQSYNLSKKYQLREYIEEIIAESFLNMDAALDKLFDQIS